MAKNHYHWDCAAIKQEIQDSAQTYAEYSGDKTQYPLAISRNHYFGFQNQVPIDYIKKRMEYSKLYYKNKPAYVLYGIRKLYWEKERKV